MKAAAARTVLHNNHEMQMEYYMYFPKVIKQYPLCCKNITYAPIQNHQLEFEVEPQVRKKDI